MPPLNLTCTNEQKIPVTLNPMTGGGRPAQLDGPPRVTVTAGDSTVVITGPLTFEVISSDVPGVTEYLVEADALLGPGEILLPDTVSLTVASASAASLGMIAGEAVPK